MMLSFRRLVMDVGTMENYHIGAKNVRYGARTLTQGSELRRLSLCGGVIPTTSARVRST